MNGKTSKAKPKMADVTRPKRPTSADSGSDSLVIQSRPIIGRATSVSSPSDDQTTQDDSANSVNPEMTSTPSAPVLPSQSKKLIVPISDEFTKDTAAAKAAPIADAAPEQSKTEEPVASVSKEDSPADTPKEAASEETSEPETEKPAEAPAEKRAADENDTDEAEADDGKADKKEDKPSPETEKAVAEAAAAVKRQNELESLIDSKQFYVPINAVARKREVKHSALMTILVLLLALVLIDLMLDSGLILLAEKIPHTHFFTISNPN